MGFIIADTNRRWPDGLIPYEIAPGFGSNESTIVLAMRIWETSTHGVIRFRPRDSEDDYLFVVCTGGISQSQIGRIGERQFAQLNYTFAGRLCRGGNPRLGVTLHELGHTIGLLHEVQRPSRDQHVTIRDENVRRPRAFTRLCGDTTRPSCGIPWLPYDHESIMHYLPNQAAVDSRRPTIVAPGHAMNAQCTARLSEGDVHTVMHFYPANDSD